MTDAEIIQRAKQTFVLDTPTERLARELIGVAERCLAQNDSLKRRLQSVWSDFLERMDR